MKQYFIVALFISIFLGLIFSPSQVITIFFQGAYLVVVIIYVLLSAIIVLASALIYVVVSLLISAINFIIEPNISSKFILNVQSDGLKGTYALYTGLVQFLYDISIINADLFGLDIQFSQGQSVFDSFDISITSLGTLFTNVWNGITEPVRDFFDDWREANRVD